MTPFVEAIHPKQINDQGNGLVTVTIINPWPGLLCFPPGQPPRPALTGDVLSVQPPAADGSIVLQARVAGTNGAFEVAKIIGAAVVWAPLGARTYAVMAPYAADIPNV